MGSDAGDGRVHAERGKTVSHGKRTLQTNMSDLIINVELRAR